jgi:RNA polymerase sigma-70 factor (ECF subfamily)
METFVMPIREGGFAIDRRQDQERSANPARREAFADLVRAHDRELRSLAFRLLGDRDLMDDALQEAYLRAYRALPSFREEASTATWLHRITYNVCLDRLRDRKRTVQHLGSVRSPEGMAERGLEPRSADDPAAAAERKDALGIALAGLPPDQRAAVLLVDAMGYDYGTAANILGVKEGTIASRLHNARALLRGALSARHEEGLR